jgi:hypothetical protein
MKDCMSSSDDKQHAPGDWLSSFLKWKNTLSIRSPRATSLGRATSFIKHNVEMFFANFSNIYDKFIFQCQYIYNVDETAITTVQKPTRILAKKSVKQTEAVTSSEEVLWSPWPWL